MKRLLLFSLTVLLLQADVFANNQHLKLTSMCSDNPATTLRWRVRNNNSNPITYTWRIVDGGPNAPASSQYGTAFIAQPGDNFFFSPKWATGNNVMVIYVGGVEQNGGRKAAGYQTCSTKNFDIFVSCKKQVDACTWLVTFGYTNDNPGLTFTIPHGNDNKFTGGDIIRGESDTVFPSGTYYDAFKVRIACNTTVVWHLKGSFGPRSVNTTAPYTNYCKETVKPFVNCINWDPSKAGEMTVSYGYENTGTDTVVIPQGADNLFKSSVWGTPITHFAPGVHNNVCQANFTGNDMTWHLKDYNNIEHDAIAYNQYVSQCVEPIKPHVNCIKHNQDGSVTAYFNYENFNSSTQTIYKGERNYLVGETVVVNHTEAFITGYKTDAFNATFTGKELKWILTGPDGVTRYAIASDEYCKECDSNNNGNGNGGGHIVTGSHPNPSNGRIALTIDNAEFEAETYTVSVCDMYGRIQHTAEYPVETTTFDVDLTKNIKGIYTVNVRCDKKSDAVRVVKE